MLKDNLLIDSVIGNAKVQLHLIPITNKTSRSQMGMTPRYITIHNTGNKNADALANSKYVDSAAGYVSWHFTVDDKMIYQELPTNEVAWHAGDGRGTGNMSSIGIEICEHVGQDWEKAKANAIALIITLMQDLKIPLENVVPHQRWSGKYCPRVILNEGWDKFINQIKISQGEEWERILKRCLDKPEEWIAWIKVQKGIGQFLPALIEKVYKSK